MNLSWCISLIAQWIRTCKFLFLVHTHSTNLNIRLWNPHSIHSWLPRETQTLIWNFPMCVGNTIKDHFRLICFQSYEKCREFNYLWRFCAVPWDREIQIKTINVAAKPWAWPVCYSTLFQNWQNNAFVVLSILWKNLRTPVFDTKNFYLSQE